MYDGEYLVIDLTNPRKIAGFSLSRMNTTLIDNSPKTFHIYGYTTNTNTWFEIFSTTLEDAIGINTNMTSFHKNNDPNENFSSNTSREFYKIAIVVSEIFPFQEKMRRL